MEVEHLCRSCPLVEVVHVLRDDPNVIGSLELDERAMRGVRLRRTNRLASLVVEPENTCGISIPGLRRGHILDPVPLPEAVGTTKRL